MGFTNNELEIIRAVDSGVVTVNAISLLTGKSVGVVGRTLASLRKWDFVRYHTERHIAYNESRRWFLTEEFFKHYGELVSGVV